MGRLSYLNSMESTLYKLRVSRPCKQNWEEMVPGASGRFCAACQTSVIDFTTMSDEAIIRYFREGGVTEGCGRFLQPQLERIRIEIPAYLPYKRIAAWKKFLVVFLFCFGGSLFQLDVYWQGGNGLHAQTVTITGKSKKIKSKKPKVRIKKITRKEITVSGLEFITMGFFAPAPDKPCIPMPPLELSGKATAQTKVEWSGEKPPQEPPPAKKKPFGHYEAMLPLMARLRYRSRNRK